MGLLKRTLFMLIPITTLLIAISYGIDAIFGNQLNLTYLQTITINEGTTQETSYLIYDFKSYLNNLRLDNILEPLKNLAKSINIITEPIETIMKIWKDGYQFGDGIKTIANALTTIINVLIWLIDMSFSILQIGIIIIGKLLSLIGINTESDFILIKIFREFTKFTIIPGIPPWE